MLTQDVITKTEALKALEPEQVEAVKNLAENYMQAEVDKHAKKVHTGYDETFERLGFPKEDGVKSYAHIEKVVTGLKTQNEELKKFEDEKAKLESKITDLQTKIKEGKGNDALKQQLKDWESKYQGLEEKYKSDLSEREQKLAEVEKRTMEIEANRQFYEAASRMKPNKAYDDDVRETYLQNKMNETKSELTPDYIEDRGKTILAWRDKDGNIIRNKDDGMKPMDLFEITNQKHDLSKVFDIGRKQEGAGSRAPERKGDASGLLAEAKTKTQAMSAIVAHLAADGIGRGDDNFQAKIDELWESSGADKLPQ